MADLVETAVSTIPAGESTSSQDLFEQFGVSPIGAPKKPFVVTRIPKRKQKAVYWPPEEEDRFGRRKVSSPVEVNVRWEDINEAFIARGGEELISKAKIFPDVLPEPGGYLWKGPISEAPIDPIKNKDAFKIMRVDDLPDFNNRKHLVTVFI